MKDPVERKRYDRPGRPSVLTEKMKAFAREYYGNGGNGARAYMAAYNSQSYNSAATEAIKLLGRDDVRAYLKELSRPDEMRALASREQKRTIIWDRIQLCIERDDDRAIARYMDILNKMDSEYVNINRNIEEKTDISNLDTDQLLALVGGSTESEDDDDVFEIQLN